MIIILYLILGYWATGVILYENKTIIYTQGALFKRKLLIGTAMGWCFIPLAILKKIFRGKG